ncbi:MAG TPA: DNA-directed RNA polymerase subunit alpha [Planctomycetota bacterium]|nr:DNA-directed RNA polymerase subunit alpha [Planctomycetota bacterium]
MRIRWKEFELPTRVVMDEKSATPTYASFTSEPFERGFGTTVGNAIRRVLYSSIEGAAVTAVRIKGVAHEFATIEGVVEDVTDIVLNLKQLVVKMTGDTPAKTLILETSKKGPVKGGHIQPEAGVEIVNPDLHLFTLADDSKVSVEIDVRRGRRYVTAEEHARDHGELNVIHIDSSFSPVRRVRYRVENTRVGKLTNYDRLVLEIWTNGTVTPEEALVEATKILRKHLNPFVQYFELGRELQINEKKEEDLRKKEKEREELRLKLSMSISELDLSVRSANCLASERIETLGELVSRSEADLLKVRNFGKTSLREVKKKLSELGLVLGMDVEGVVGKKPATAPTA